MAMTLWSQYANLIIFFESAKGADKNKTDTTKKAAVL